MRNPTVPFLAACLLTVAAAASAPAQQVAAGRERVDGIAAIVGDEVVLHSDVQLGVQVILQQSGRAPASFTDLEIGRFEEQVLQQIITQKLIVARARRDSVVVSRGEIESELDAQIDVIRQNLGGPDRFEQALRQEGLTLAELRKRLFEQVETNLLQSKLMQQNRLGMPGPVSRREAAAFLSEHADELYVFQQILLRPPEGLDPVQSALTEIQEIRRRIVEEGADFAELARRHSADGSASEGGDLGDYPRNSFVPEFESAAWSLPIGELSRPIRTTYGWHLIEVLERDETNVRVRHILIRPEEGGALVTALADRIAEIRSRLEAGESFGALIQEHTTGEDLAARSGYMGLFIPPLADTRVNSPLPPSWIEPLQSLQPGEWSGALEDTAGVHIVRRMGLAGRGSDLVLQYDFSAVEQLVRRQRQNQEFEEWLQELRDQTYIEIKRRL